VRGNWPSSAPADFIRYASTVVVFPTAMQIGVMEDTDDILALAEIALSNSLMTTSLTKEVDA